MPDDPDEFDINDLPDMVEHWKASRVRDVVPPKPPTLADSALLNKLADSGQRGTVVNRKLRDDGTIDEEVIENVAIAKRLASDPYRKTPTMTDQTQQPNQPTADADTPPDTDTVGTADTEVAEEDANPNHEAAKWRNKFREAERDGLAAQLDAVRTDQANAYATAAGITPKPCGRPGRSCPSFSTTTVWWTPTRSPRPSPRPAPNSASPPNSRRGWDVPDSGRRGHPAIPGVTLSAPASSRITFNAQVA